jgi:NAD-dependent deacetylase
MPDSAQTRVAALLRNAQRVVVFTGAGVSAESGVPTFRGAGGLWEGRPVERLASWGGFEADPVVVWEFYQQRRANLARVKPNPAHEVIARWQHRFASYTIATQNVDGLHQAAGAQGVLELHGSIWVVRCAACGRERVDRTVPFPTLPPRCAVCEGFERPGVVWFGETLPEAVLDAATAAAGECDVLLVVGTSAVVYPAAGLVHVAASAGAAIVEVNPEPSAISHIATHTLRGPAGEILPAVDSLLEGAPA